MRRHALDPVSLVFGLAFAGAGLLFLAGQADQAVRLRWLWPFLLLVLGVGILLDVGRRPREERPEPPATPTEPLPAAAEPPAEAAEPTAGPAAEAAAPAEPEPQPPAASRTAEPDPEPPASTTTAELDPERPPDRDR
jgi:hypothetical protein